MRKRSFFGLAALAAFGLGLHGWAGSPTSQNLVTSYDWANDDPDFGGLSAIELSDDGLSFTAISDRSTLFSGRFERSADGAIQAVSNVVAHRLQGPNGRPLDSAHDDSEGLALLDNGTFYISQEGPARVLRFTGPDAAAEVLPQHPDFAAMQVNSALETLAVNGNGTLFTLPERSGALDRPFPVYRFANGHWSKPLAIPRVGAYLPTGADFGPDGRLYILERRFEGIAGFQNRVRRFAITGDTIESDETVLETYLGQHGNLEGLSVWRDADGSLRLTMVSDDNFRFFLRTTLVEYAIAD
ncbi:MAG: hypothetical protein RLZZ437_2284 [Pseudomonadota bacterium]|jgi:hypothetical protein